MNRIILILLVIFFTSSTDLLAQDHNVQHIQTDVPRTGTTTGITAVSSLNSAFVLANNNRKVNAGPDGNTGDMEGNTMAGAQRLTATGTITYYREGASLNANTRFNSSIWEYTGTPGGNNEFVVRGRYTVSLNGTTNSTTQAISGISNADKCIPFITGIMNDATVDDADSGTAIAYLENATTMRVLKGSNGNNVTVYITLVEFTGSNWTVLHGDSGNSGADTGIITLRDNSDGTGTATNVSAWGEAVIFGQHIGDTGTSGVNEALADNWPLFEEGSNDQQVDWTFNVGHDSDGTNRHFVHVLNNPEISVTRFQSTSNTTGETTIDITSAGLTNLNEAFIVGSSITSGGGTAYGRGWRNYYLNSTTQAAHWSHRSGNTMNHEIQIVDLSVPPAGPANDDCAGAVALTVNPGTTCTTSTTGDSTGASQSLAAVNCAGFTGNADDDVWFSFVATAAAHDITVTPITLNDAVVDLRSGACDGTNIACADGFLGAGAETINATGLTIGNTYFVRVYSYDAGSGNEGTFDVCVTTPAPPSGNDDCPGTLLTVNPTDTCTVSTAGDTTGMTQTIAGVSCNGFTGNSDDDVWYQFVATAPNHDITVTPGTLSDAVVDLRSGACNGTNIACADNTVGSSPEVINASGLTIGNTYYVRVYSYGGSGSEGTFDICVTTPGPYCQPTTNTPDTAYVDTVGFLGTLEDVTNAGTGFSGGFQDFTGLPTLSRQVEGEGVNVYVEANQSVRWRAWVDWDSDGFYDDATELVYDSDNVITLSTTFGFVIPGGTAAGDYRMRIRCYKRWNSPPGEWVWSYDFNSCENFGVGSGYEDYGEAEDYLFTVEPICDANIGSVTDGDTCGPGTVNLSVTGSGTVTGFRWYDSETGGSLLFDDVAATGNWTTPSISTTTSYWVTAYNGTCESYKREEVIANFSPVPTLSITPTAASERVVCGENSILELTATGDIDAIYLIDEDFESGMGAFENIVINDNGAPINALTEWQVRTSTFIPAEQVWFPAIASDFGTDQFVMSNSDVGAYTTENALTTTSSYDTSGYSNLILSMRMYYSHYLPDGSGATDDYVAIEASTDGSSWTAITPNIVADVGIGTRFSKLSYDMSAYVDEPTLWLRVRFYAVWADGVAIDDIQLFGDKDITAVEWNTTPSNAVDLYLDSGATIPYVSGAETTVYAMPNLSQLEDADFDFTVDANLANGCGLASENFTITNRTKIWNGTTARWDTSANWLPNGIPNSDTCVVIRDNGGSPDPLIGIPMPPSPQYAYNLVVKSGGFLEIETQRWLTVTDQVTVDPGGLLYIRDSGSLIQINDVVNSGDIYMERSPKFSGAAVGNLEYVYWSSPVDAFSVNQVSPNANASMRWEWVPSVPGNGAGQHGDWSSASGNMTVGKGYTVRGLSGTPSNYPITGFPAVSLSANSALFNGVPNNGDINIPIYHGGWNAGSGSYLSPSGNTATELDDNWNFLGNPYPSAISADDFIFANAANIQDDATPAIIGTVWLWSHENLGSVANPNPFYDNFQYNYNANDYTEYNYMGANPPGFNGYIAAGQGFFVLADDSVDTGGADSVVFNNSMRSDTYSNDNFLGANPEGQEMTINGPERHRLWLDLITPDNTANTILVGYATGATDNIDNLYDAYEYAGSDVSFYSLINDKEMSIQGRSLPFNDEDVVPLGLKVVQNGSYYIGINALDGLFEDPLQGIYLEDTQNGFLHDLRSAPYSFYTEGGEINDRFKLRFQREILNIEEVEIDSISILSIEDLITINSASVMIKEVTVFDLIGRIVTRQKIDDTEGQISTRGWAKAPYMVQLSMDNGQKLIKKVIKR